jgi:hypothetical protein
MSDIEREEFEQAFLNQYTDFERFENGEYIDDFLQQSWIGWQASRQAVSVPEWIKCSERLPESGITVLVSNNSGAIYTCRRSVIERKNLEPDGADFTREWFTHWMPLPDPPKQEQSHE